jgi:hypothetical protein
MCPRSATRSRSPPVPPGFRERRAHNARGYRTPKMCRGTFSGMTTRKTPAKNDHAASKPAITASVVWVKLSHT